MVSQYFATENRSLLSMLQTIFIISIIFYLIKYSLSYFKLNTKLSILNMKRRSSEYVGSCPQENINSCKTSVVVIHKSIRKKFHPRGEQTMSHIYALTRCCFKQLMSVCINEVICSASWLQFFSFQALLLIPKVQ